MYSCFVISTFNLHSHITHFQMRNCEIMNGRHTCMTILKRNTCTVVSYFRFWIYIATLQHFQIRNCEMMNTRVKIKNNWLYCWFVFSILNWGTVFITFSNSKVRKYLFTCFFHITFKVVEFIHRSKLKTRLTSLNSVTQMTAS